MTCKRLAAYFSNLDPGGVTWAQVVKPYVSRIEPNISAPRAQIQMLADFASAIDEVARSRLASASKDKHIERLKDISERLVVALPNLAPTRAFGSVFAVSSTADYLETLADAVEGEDHDAQPEPLDRQQIIASIDELVSVIADSVLDRTAKKAIVLQLSAIQKICLESAVFSEAELRLRIKAIMADLMISWSSIRAQDESAAEKVKAWVWGAAAKVRSGLGLTADVTQLTALLPPG